MNSVDRFYVALTVFFLGILAAATYTELRSRISALDDELDKMQRDRDLDEDRERHRRDYSELADERDDLSAKLYEAQDRLERLQAGAPLVETPTKPGKRYTNATDVGVVG